MTQVSQGAIAVVGALIALTVKTNKGDVTLPNLPGTGGDTLDLTEEGDVMFVDPNVKGQAPRKEKIREAREDRGLTCSDVAFYSEASKKYGLIIRCLGCGVPTRKWTSDIHQSHRCDTCTAKFKKATSKAKRSAMKAALPQAQPAQAQPAQAIVSKPAEDIENDAASDSDGDDQN